MSKLMTARKSRILPVLLAALALPMIICLEAPFEIYGSNLDEFLFSLSDFLPFCLLIWLVGAAAIGALLFFLPDRAYRFAYPITVAAAFLFFLQGTYLNLGLSSLPGDNMGEDTISAGAIILNAMIWILVLGLAAASAFLKKGDFVKPVCILLSVIVLGTQTVNTVFVALSNDQIAVPKHDRLNQVGSEGVTRLMTRENLTTLAKERNVFVFLVDRFDETFAEKAYRESPEVYSELTGFTWFQDHIALFGHTYPAVTWMLTDTPYSGEQDRDEYFGEAFKGETPLKRLHDAGYSVNVYTQTYYVYDDASSLPDYFDNVLPTLEIASIPPIDQLAIAGNMMGMALYRCLPFALKGIMGGISSDANAKIVLESRSGNAYSLDMKDVYDTITQADFTQDGDKTFSFIHLTGCHDVSYDEDWKTPSITEVGDYAVSVRTSFQIIDRYIAQMKQMGVYDDATIIITGDHSAPISDSREVREPRLTALFAKPAGQGGDTPMRISSAQVSHDDFWATILKSEGMDFAAEYGTSVFDVPEGMNRLRYHRWQTYVRGSMDEYTYEISGSGSNFDNWKEVGHDQYDKSLMD